MRPPAGQRHQLGPGHWAGLGPWLSFLLRSRLWATVALLGLLAVGLVSLGREGAPLPRVGDEGDDASGQAQGTEGVGEGSAAAPSWVAHGRRAAPSTSQGPRDPSAGESGLGGEAGAGAGAATGAGDAAAAAAAASAGTGSGSAAQGPAGAPPLPTKNGSVAICLAGGLRLLELTGVSLVRHVFQAYPGADVFVHAPLDQDSHRLLLLPAISRALLEDDRDPGAGARARGSQPWVLRAVEFLAQAPLDEASTGASVLTTVGSPNGVQGLLQYFQLVEGCLALIESEERRWGFRYDWVIRTRPDGLWAAALPESLQGLPQNAYLYPEGSSWGGLNDRLGVAKRALAGQALKRLSVLTTLAAENEGSKLNSELCLKLYLKSMGIEAVPQSYPFCTLSQRVYKYPPPVNGAPVFALNGTAVLNGAKCRPCQPVSGGEAALGILEGLREGQGVPWDAPRKEGINDGYLLCDPTKPWAEGWEAIFDSQAGKVASSVRSAFAGLSMQSCVSELDGFLAPIEGYTGPSGDLLCKLKDWGPVLKALSKAGATAAEVEEAIESVSPGRLAGALDKAIVLDQWKEEGLPLPKLNASEPCDPCHWLVQVTGKQEVLPRKHELVAAYRHHRWSLVKCGGEYLNQQCLFLLSTQP